MYEYRATLLSVVDGDTMHFAVDLGLDETRKLTVRVLGVNSPELRTAEGQTAKLWAIDWFNQHCVNGLVTLNTVKDKTEKYGRYLATITAGDGHVYNDDLLAAHQAVRYNP